MEGSAASQRSGTRASDGRIPGVQDMSRSAVVGMKVAKEVSLNYRRYCTLARLR